MPPQIGAGGSDTEVYSWGQGGLGQLGHSDDTTYKAPRVLVATMGLRVLAVATGERERGGAFLPDN